MSIIIVETYIGSHYEEKNTYNINIYVMNDYVTFLFKFKLLDWIHWFFDLPHVTWMTIHNNLERNFIIF